MSTGFAWGPLLILLLASSLGVMGGVIVVPVLDVMRQELNLSETAAGLIITSHGLTIAFTSPIAGWMVDRWGLRWPMAGGLILYGLAGGSGLFIDNYTGLIISRIFFGLGTAIVFTISTVAFFTLYQGSARNQMMGWRSSATSLGALVWPLVGGALGGISWNAAFGTYLVAIPIGIATCWLMPNDRPSQKRPEGNAFTLLTGYPAICWVYILLMALAMMSFALAVFLPQRLGQLGVTRPLTVSLYMVAMSSAAIVTAMGYSRLRELASYETMLRLSFVAWTAAFLILGLVSSPAILVLSPILVGIAQGLGFPAVTVLIGELVPNNLWGRATALSSTLMFLGQFLAPVILGPLASMISIPGVYLLLAAAASLLLLILLLTRISPRRALPAG